MATNTQPQKTTLVTISNDDWRMLKPWEKARSLRSQLATRVDQVNSICDAELLPMVPKYMSRFVGYCAKKRDVMECSPQSLIDAFEESIRTRTPVDGKLGYVVPYEISTQNGKEPRAVFMASWLGMLAAAKRAGRIISGRCFIVCEKDQFEHGQDGALPFLRYSPVFGDRGAFTGVCAVVEMSRDPLLWDYEYLAKAEVEKIKNSSPSKNKGPWVDWPDEMAKKSAIRRLLKRHFDDPSLIELFEAEDGVFGIDTTRRRASISTMSGSHKPEAGRVYDLTLDADPSDASGSDSDNQADPADNRSRDVWTRERILGLFGEASKQGVAAVKKLVNDLTGPDSPLPDDRLLEYAKKIGGDSIKVLESKGGSK